MVDKSDFNGLARVAFLKHPKITVRLESSVVDFTALMKSFEKDEQKPANKDKQKRRLFSDDPLPFDVLKQVDADIVLKARNMHAKDARLAPGDESLDVETVGAHHTRGQVGDARANAGLFQISRHRRKADGVHVENRFRRNKIAAHRAL